jgi:hypothetical protein
MGAAASLVWPVALPVLFFTILAFKGQPKRIDLASIERMEHELGIGERR